MSLKRWPILFLHAFVGWLLCAVTMMLAQSATSLENALVVHAVAAPLIFGAVSALYFRHFAWSSPLPTAAVFVGVVTALDVLVVGVLIQKSLAMFTSVIGTWIPFALIFLATFAVGNWLSAHLYTAPTLARRGHHESARTVDQRGDRRNPGWRPGGVRRAVVAGPGARIA